MDNNKPKCPACVSDLELRDTTYSNINTDRCYKGEKTGDIYYCKSCDDWYLDNYLSGDLEHWSY